MTTPQFPSYIKKIYSHELVGIYLFLICLLAAGMPSASQSCGKSWGFFLNQEVLMLTSPSNFMSSDCNHDDHHHSHHYHDHRDDLTSDGGIHLRLPLVHHARRLPLLTSFSPPGDVSCRRPGHSVRQKDTKMSMITQGYWDTHKFSHQQRQRQRHTHKEGHSHIGERKSKRALAATHIR